jgi:hypothetical protein
MKKYLIKNLSTGEETLCERIELEGFEYYVANHEAYGTVGYISTEHGGVIGNIHYDEKNLTWDLRTYGSIHYPFSSKEHIKTVICTTAPLPDVPQVVDLVEEMAGSEYQKNKGKVDKLTLDEQIQRSGGFIVGYKTGYKSSQSTHPFSVEDMISFGTWLMKNGATTYGNLLSIWQQQQPTKIFCK